MQKHETYIINKIEEDATLSTKELSKLMKSEFDLDLCKTTIQKCLKSNMFHISTLNKDEKYRALERNERKLKNLVTFKIQISVIYSLLIKQPSKLIIL